MRHLLQQSVVTGPNPLGPRRTGLTQTTSATAIFTGLYETGTAIHAEKHYPSRQKLPIDPANIAWGETAVAAEAEVKSLKFNMPAFSEILAPTLHKGRRTIHRGAS